MAKSAFRFQMYKKLQAEIPQIYAELRQAADEIGIPAQLRGKFGLTGAISGCPAPLREDILAAGERGASEVIPLAKLVEEIRELVKSVYGDEYDACPVNTCEGGLWIAYDTLFSPPNMGRGDNYRARYLVPWEKHLHHHGSYGRPFPAWMKDLFADRGTTAGELGFYAKRQNNLDAVIVPLDGADYSPHGIKYHPVPLLTRVDVKASAARFERTLARHASLVTGITSLGYDTPGYGYGEHDKHGTPLLQKALADLAHVYDLPYVVDNAWGLPFVGTDLRQTGADVVVYSMDKATGSATSGLIIGKERYMVSIRRAMGMHGDRWGTLASYGKAGYVTQDPGKEALLTQVQALRVLRDQPQLVTKPMEDLHTIVVEEFGKIDSRLKGAFRITKSFNSNAVEVNYEASWAGGMGIPIFSIEDMYAGSNLFQSGPAQMGVIPTIGYDGNIFIAPGLGTTDAHGQLVPELARYAVRALVRTIEIVCAHAGILG